MDISTRFQISSGRQNVRTWRRFAAVLAALTVFFGVASLIKPEPRAASAGDTANSPLRTQVSGKGAAQLAPRVAEETVAQRLGRTVHPLGWRMMGQLEGREYHVLVFASPDGPRYSVYSLRGDLILPDLAGDDVYRNFPTLDITPLRDLPSDESKAIMLAEPLE